MLYTKTYHSGKNARATSDAFWQACAYDKRDNIFLVDTTTLVLGTNISIP